MHEGHSCAKASDFIKTTYTNSCSGQEAGLSQLLTRNKPDMVMMTLGTNDAWGVPGTQAILASYTTLVQQMRAYNPNMVIAVAQIPKMRPDNNQAVYNQVEDLFKAVPAWAKNLNQTNSPIIVADLWTNFNVSDTTDGVHPSDSVGHPKVADNWYKAVAEYLR
jgi:lysophospholipase L1-like esterase